MSFCQTGANAKLKGKRDSVLLLFSGLSFSSCKLSRSRLEGSRFPYRSEDWLMAGNEASDIL